jgi:hypothetical protein
MKKLIMISVLAAGILIILSGCCHCVEKKHDRQCCMCKKGINQKRCIKTECGKVGYPCAQYCKMCTRCKKVYTPNEEKFCQCEGKCSCGMNLQEMGKMQSADMCKLQEEQREHLTKCCMCKQKLNSGQCLKTKCGMVSFKCAKHCMMCPKCKTVITPEEMKSCKQQDMCCGTKLQSMKTMSENDMVKLRSDQAKCIKEMCPKE